MYGIITDQITDQSRDSRSGSLFVFSAWPNKVAKSRHSGRAGDFTGAKWVGYPFVVLTNEVNTSKNLTLNRGLKEKVVTFHADVYNKSKANTDRTSNQINEILDITESGLVGSGLSDFTIESASYTPDLDQSGASIHKNTLNWMYRYIAIK